jgi:hypothetical protein
MQSPNLLPRLSKAKSEYTFSKCSTFHASTCALQQPRLEGFMSSAPSGNATREISSPLQPGMYYNQTH